MSRDRDMADGDGRAGSSHLDFQTKRKSTVNPFVSFRTAVQLIMRPHTERPRSSVGRVLFPVQVIATEATVPVDDFVTVDPDISTSPADG